MGDVVRSQDIKLSYCVAGIMAHMPAAAVYGIRIITAVKVCIYEHTLDAK